MLDKQVIVELGGPEALIKAGYTLGQIKQWRRRGIAWSERPKLAELAEKQNIDLPADFLMKRRPAKSRKAA
ncbi:MAG: hypothetical protein Q8R02_23275 [Hyphomonadaceae bacterium]|nr:hypothetical protein [Hyphomonadaceae bacterium]